MNAPTRSVVLTSAVLALAAVLAACGSTTTNKVAPPAAAPASAATEAPAAPTGKAGTRTNPAAIGQVVTISESGVPKWEVSLSAPSLDATAAAAANEFNEPAPASQVYAEVTVNVKRLDSTPADPYFDLDVEFVSAAGTTHSPLDNSVSIDKGALMDLGEMYAPATGSGAVIIAIPVADAAAGTWTVSSGFDADKTFFKAV